MDVHKASKSYNMKSKKFNILFWMVVAWFLMIFVFYLTGIIEKDIPVGILSIGLVVIIGYALIGTIKK